LAKALNLAVRVIIAAVLGICLIRFAAGSGIVLPIIGAFYGLILFLLFGFPLLQRVGDTASRLFVPDDAHFRIMPEYSVAEARVKEGKYQEAVDEYRKVIAEYPDDVYPHVRIADLAVTHLKDTKLAELELLSAVAKAQGEDTTAIVAGRLADLYQFTLQQPRRALEVMEQLCAKLPGSKAAVLAEERIRTLRELVAGRELPKTPTKIAARPSRYKISE
jgi:tetratricopeptide (TPR) repeat protein